MATYVNVMDKDKKWCRRWITVHNDFAMYFYKKHKVGHSNAKLFTSLKDQET